MTVRILVGDALSQLRTLPDESVHCCVSSPPYWGLRAYTGDPGMIGLEPTFDEHLANLVHVFREVRRVLRDDGTCWVNYGDSYANVGASGPQAAGGQMGDRSVQRARLQVKRDQGGLKPKDLMMMPARVAMALQDDGWYLRSEIVWHKPNPMPESVTDRPTCAHEKVFLLAKKPRYYYDAEAVRVAYATSTTERFKDGSPQRVSEKAGERNSRQFETVGGLANGGRNLRNVWKIPSAPYSEAHFATFPPALVEPCIKAGTSEKGVCGECGAPWVRETKTIYENPGNRTTNGGRSLTRRHETAGFGVRLEKRVSTTGWHPSCECNAGEPVPATCLDPFGGAGTTGMVADRLQRNAILVEISPEYAEMARKRIEGDDPLFADVRMTPA